MNSVTSPDDASAPNLEIDIFDITNNVVTIAIASDEGTEFTLNSLKIGDNTIDHSDVVITGQISAYATFTYAVPDGPITGTVSFSINGTDVSNNAATITQADHNEILNVTSLPVSVTLRSLDVKPGYRTSLSTVHFNVTFSVPVSGFIPDDIKISGSVNNFSPVVSNFRGSGISYTFEVQREGADGNITVGIPANTIQNNTASEYITVTIDNTIPVFSSASFINERTIRLYFSEPVKNNFIAASDFIITNIANVSVISIDKRIYASTIAGNGTRGDTVGERSSATFDGLNDTIVLPDGDLLVLDRGNNKIKRVNSTHVSTAFDLGDTNIGHPNSFARGQDGLIYFTTPMGVYKLLPNELIRTVLTVDNPNGIDVGFDGLLYVSVNNSRDAAVINPNDGSFTELFPTHDDRSVSVGIATLPNGSSYVSVTGFSSVGPYQ